MNKHGTLGLQSKNGVAPTLLGLRFLTAHSMLRPYRHALLNGDYKILAKVWINRLKFFMPFMVHFDQTCAVPERDIRDSLLNLYNVVETIGLERTHGMLFSVDHTWLHQNDLLSWPRFFHGPD